MATLVWCPTGATVTGQRPVILCGPEGTTMDFEVLSSPLRVETTHFQRATAAAARVVKAFFPGRNQQCPCCNGTGKARQTRFLPDGTKMTAVESCPICHGTGKRAAREIQTK